jgi:hypothetical protein
MEAALPGAMPHLIVHFRNWGTEPAIFSHDFTRSIEVE